MDYTNLPTSLNVPSQLPLDHKMFIESEELLSESSTLEMRAFTYFQGLKITCLKEMVDYEWKPVAEYEQDALLQQAFKYPPSAPIVGGVDYSNKYFNFYKVHTLTRSEVEGLIPTPPVQLRYRLENIGEGAGLVKDGTSQNFKIKTLKTNTLNITETENEITIDAPITESGIKMYYVNQRYTGNIQDGTPAKPYKRLIFAISEIIGNGTTLDPEIPMSEIVIQGNAHISQSEFDQNPKLNGKISINGLSLKGESPNTIVYIDSRADYVIDTQYLFENATLEPTGNLNKEIKLSFTNITIISTASLGILRHFCFKNPKLESPNKNIHIDMYDCSLISGKDDDRYHKLTDFDNADVILFGSQVWCQNSIPITTPHLILKGNNGVGSSGFVAENLNIVGRSQVCVHLEDCAVFFDNWKVQYDPYYINYSAGDSEILYKPKENLQMIKILDSYTSGYIRNQTHYPSSKNQFSGYRPAGGPFTVLYLKVSSYELNLNEMMYEGYNMAYKHFIEAEKDVTYFKIRNTNMANDYLQDSFVKLNSLRTSNIELNIEGSVLTRITNTSLAKYDLTATSALVNGFEYNSTISFANDTNALAAGLVKNNIYYNTTTNSLKRIT